MTPQQRFDLHKDDVRYNTSYPLSAEDWEPYRVKSPLNFAHEDELSFYIHIPYCKSLCKFCEYVKYPIPEEIYQQSYLKVVETDINRFVDSLSRNKQDKLKVSLCGFDIGGGTPTALSHKAFEQLLALVENTASKFHLLPDFMGSIEGSFSTIDCDKIAMIGSLRKYIQRISFGLQNVNPVWLKSQNRTNNHVSHIISTIQQCRKCGICYINIDLMYGFPDQSKGSFDSTLELVSQINPEHLTLYELRTNMLDYRPIARTEERFSQYQYLYDRITSMGYNGRFGCNTFSLLQDEGVSSYLQHRMIPGGSYKGFGISAQSKSRDCISYNYGKRHEPFDEIFLNRTCEAGKFGGDIYLLPPEEMVAKYVAICGYCGRFDLGRIGEILQTDTSIASVNPTNEINREVGTKAVGQSKSHKTNIDRALRRYGEEVNFLLDNGYLEIDDDLAIITPQGFKYYGAVLSMFYPEK